MVRKMTNKNTMELKICNDPQDDKPIHFYEFQHYYLSNFSAFNVEFEGFNFPTSEHAYQACKFLSVKNNGITFGSALFLKVACAKSAHEAMTIARENKDKQREDWDVIKRDWMKDICRAKMYQHEYIKRRLLLTKNNLLIEVSPVDSFWGWGPNKDGRNELGKIWMELREELANR
jgi:ribA/ribD-fused uncharacterized protein